MKKAIKQQILLLLVLISSNIYLYGQTSKQNEILAFLKNHEQNFKNRNALKLKEDWLHDSSVEYITTLNNYSQHLVGWHKIDSLLNDVTSNAVFDNIVSVENYKITRQDAHLAIAENDRNRFDATQNLAYTIHRSIVLVKQQTKWKIASITNTIPASYLNNALNTENALNTAGYELLAMKDFEKAIEIFILNTKYYPQSWNTYDSLGEAYLKNGNTALAIENYEKSVALNPKNLVGIEVLKKLKGK